MIYQLHVRKKAEDELVLGLGHGWRVAFGVLTGLMLWMLLNTGIAPIPAVLLLVSLVATLYHERWVVLPRESVIESHIGLLFLPRKRRYPATRMRRVVLRHSSSAGPSTTALAKDSGGLLSRALEKRMVRLGVDFHADDSAPGSVRLHANIATESERAAARLRELGRELAQYCDVPFEEL